MTATLTAHKYLTDDEREDFISLLDRHRGERDALMLSIMLHTGARSCEMVRMRVRDFHGQRVTIHAAKGSNDRDVWLPPALVKQIQRYVSDNGLSPDDLLFPITTRQFRRIWDSWRPNPRKGTHSIRHTVGGSLYLNSKDLLAVKYVLGHKNIQNTMVYLDIEVNRGLAGKMRGMLKQKFESEDDDG